MVETINLPLLLTFLLVVLTLVIKRVANKIPNLPPSPWKLPLIGNMHHLLGTLPHRALHKLAQKHGPIMHLKLGQIDNVIISSPEAAREILKTHDLIFASRPHLVAPTVLFYGNQDIAFLPYNKNWRRLRSICVNELLSSRRVKSFSHVREPEISKLINLISALAGKSPVNLTKKLLMLIHSNIARSAFGSEFMHRSLLISEIKKAFQLLSAFYLVDLFPSLSFLSELLGTSSTMEKTQNRIDRIFDEIIAEHQQNNLTDKGGEKQEYLLDVLMRLHEQGDSALTITHIKAVIMDVFAAGTETTAATLVWAMAELMQHPSAIEKVQNEVRQAAKEKEEIEETDINKLLYMKMIIKETLRLHPPVPLIPRVCRESCNISGYEVSKGTRVIVNAWAIGRDPRYWEDPESFKPERFEGSLVDFKTENFHYLPFGGGRRMCPGVDFGVATIELTLARLLFHFNWDIPEGSELSMTETSGMSASLKSDLCLIATPYFPQPAVAT